MTSYVMLSWVPLCVIGLLTDLTENACTRDCTCDLTTHRVDCANAGLSHITWNLPQPGLLKQLIMRNNSIHAIIGEIVSYVNLEDFDLSQNQIQTIDDGVFQTLPKLIYLNLQDNKLTRISERMFEQRVTSMLDLNLSKNEIVVIENGAFQSLTKLRGLKLANNRLTEIRRNMFIGLSSLRYLYINNNRITHLSSNVFEAIGCLSTLLADMNSIRNLSEQTFQHLAGLRVLSLEGNGLANLPEYLFSSKSSSPPLEQLSIKNNKLELLSSRTFQHLVNLKILDLSHNLFILLSPDAFKGLTQLQELFINNCAELEIIRDYSFAELSNLRHIEISSCPKLHEIQSNAFISSHNIRSAQLHDNALTSLDVNLLQWGKLDSLVLTGNPWNCACTLSYLSEVLQIKLNQSSMTNFQISEVRCTLPERLADRSVVDLSLAEYFCDSAGVDTADNTPQFSSSIMIAIIFTFAGALLACLGFLIWRTRDVSFHNTNRNTVSHRRRRLRKINREFSSQCSVITEGPNVVRASSYAADKPFVNSGPLDDVCLDDDDDVFQNDPDIVTSSQTQGGSGRFRKVSFSDRVVVRTYESIEELEESFENSGSDCDC